MLCISENFKERRNDMGEYGAEPQGILCGALCVLGCVSTCLTDSGIPVLDAVGITMSVDSDTDA